MQGNDNKKSRVGVLQMKWFFLFWHILQGLKGRLAVCVSEVDVLEAEVLTDGVVVRNVDSDWDAT